MIRAMKAHAVFGILVLLFAGCISGCEPSLASGQGDRDRPSNMIADAQRRQRSTQRADTIEEVHTRRHIRADQRESATHGINTTGGVLGGLKRNRWLGEGLTDRRNRSQAVPDPKELRSPQ